MKTQRQITKITLWTLTIILFLGLYLFYAIGYKYHFYWQEQNQIFLLNSDCYLSYFSKPAWAACLAGEFLTQFYYYPYIGPLILVILLATAAILIYLSLRSWLTIVWSAAISALLAAVLIFISFNSSFMLSELLCIVGGFGLFILFRKFRLWSTLIIPLAYWMFGFGALITTILICLYSIKGNIKMQVTTIIISLVFCLFTPLLLQGKYSLHYTDALFYPGLSSPELPNLDLEYTLKIDNEFYFGNYEAVSKFATEGHPTPIRGFYYYLAKAKKDSLPDYLLTYPTYELGTLNTIGEDTPLQVINLMNDLYYELGDMTYAERAAMMRNVFSPQNRNIRMIKRLAEINLVSQDTLAAMKYLRILSASPIYHQWAQSHIPGQMPLTIEQDITKRREFTNRQSTLRVGDNCRAILLELLDSNPKNIIALDYLLCTDLLLKDMDLFKADYDKYCMALGQPRLKDLYQQALMIYFAGTQGSEEDWNKYIKSQHLMKRFGEYNAKRKDPSFADTYWYYFDTH